MTCLISRIVSDTAHFRTSQFVSIKFSTFYFLLLPTAAKDGWPNNTMEGLKAVPVLSAITRCYVSTSVECVQLFWLIFTPPPPPSLSLFQLLHLFTAVVPGPLCRWLADRAVSVKLVGVSS